LSDGIELSGPSIATVERSGNTHGASPAPSRGPSLAARDPWAAAYVELKRTVVAAGLLDRRYGYYALRAGSSFALLAVALAMAFLLPLTAVWCVVTGLMLGFASTQVATIGHDAGHRTVFRRTGLNWALGQLCFTLVLGISFWFWRDRHNLHHTITNDEEDDPDLAGGGIFSLSERTAAERRGWRRFITRYQAYFFLPTITLLLGPAMRLEGLQMALTKLRGRRRLIEVTLLALSAVLWAAPIAFLGWPWVWTYVIAQLFGSLYFTCLIAPNHKGMPVWAHGLQLSYVERQVLSSRNITPGPIVDYLFGGLNYQIEHHLFPTMPRVNLGRAREIIRPFCAAHGLEYTEEDPITSYRMTFAELDRCGRAASKIAMSQPARP
jgi:fatty acid desaturase